MPDLIIGFDLDGVLADLVSAILESCVTKGLISPDIKFEDIKKWEICEILGITSDQLRDVLKSDIYETVKEHGEIVRDVRHWIKIGVPIIYITARNEEWSPGVKLATEKWLNARGLLKGTLGIKYYSAKSKHKIAKKMGINVFVDDHPMTINLMTGNIGKPFLISRPWNDNGYEWDYIKNMINEEINLRRGTFSKNFCE